jgi:hypothetical protein
MYAFLRTQQPVYHVVDSHPVWQAQESRKKPRGEDAMEFASKGQ